MNKVFFFYISLILLAFIFDGGIFCVVLQSVCAPRKRRDKAPRQICYVRYYEWTLKIMKPQREDSLEEINDSQISR